MGLALAAPAAGAERRSWNQIRYVGGTVEIETTRFDNNTTVTISLEAIAIRIAPARIFQKEQNVVLKPDQVLSLSIGTAAWRRAAEVRGAKLPPHSPSLFGLLEDARYFAIVYESNGQRGALLFTSNNMWQLLTALERVTGKDVEAH